MSYVLIHIIKCVMIPQYIEDIRNLKYICKWYYIKHLFLIWYWSILIMIRYMIIYK